MRRLLRYITLLVSAHYLAGAQETTIQQYELWRITDREHLPAIAAMVNRAYKKAVWVKDTVERITVQELTDIVQHPDKELYVCCDQEKICGAALLDYTDASQKLEMAMFTVHPDYQGKNVGALLMRFVEQQAVQAFHTRQLYIYVVPYTQERLVAYYQRNGFEIVSERPFPLLDLIRLVKPDCADKISMYEMKKNL